MNGATSPIPLSISGSSRRDRINLTTTPNRSPITVPPAAANANVPKP